MTTVDVHILQTVPPSNLNRDDTGSPKTAYYGGVRRARVSSQAWKRATRKAFEAVMDSSELGVRTKRIVELVAGEIARQSTRSQGPGDRCWPKRCLPQPESRSRRPSAKEKAGATAEVSEAPAAQAGYLVFLSMHQVAALAQLAVSASRSGVAPKPAAAKAAADSAHSIDVALFGRMVAEATDLNVDACAQVAHALSVHAVETEFDYFTAVDDRAPEDNVGAGMIGTVEFNSSTLYRYATVNVDALAKALGDSLAARRAIQAFVRAFVTSMPTGKQNTFANRTLPDAVVVMVRDGQSVNLVGAFEDAVVAEPGSSRTAEASRRLAAYATDVDAAYGTAPLHSFVVRVGAATESLAGMGDAVSLTELTEALDRVLTQQQVSSS